jgi:hypothetical protein
MQNRPSAKMPSVPPHLAPVLEAVAALDPFEDNAPESLRVGRLRELRRHLIQTAVTFLQDRPTGDDAWTDEEVTARGLGYVAAVGRYIRSVSGSFPVDPYFVAMNAHLLPVLRAGHGPGEAVEGNLLTFKGVLYADPASLLLAEAHPAAVATVTTAEGCVPFAAFGRACSAKFVWPAGAFPVLSARLADGTLLIPRATGGGLEWIVVRAGDAPAGATVSAPALSVPVLAPAAEDPLFAEQTSSLKGARGEARVYEVLAQRTTYTVRDVSHRARSADMVLETPAGKIYVDSKDYNIAVPDKEVQKFRRDLGARGAVAGVLVSLSSGIVGVRGTLTASLEALPAEGRIVPVVYVASGNPDVIAAGADLAAYLSKVHPGTLAPAGLHAHDALEAYASGLEDVADLFEDARADLARLATATAAGLGGSLEKLSLALRDHRRIVRAQRAAAEEAVEGHALLDLEDPPALWAEFEARYAGSPAVQESAVLQEVLRALGASRLGDIREAARWRFLKTKAVHVETGTVVNFLKTRTELVRPLALVTPERVGSLLARHPKKVRIADGALALELCDSTAVDALELV